MGDKENKLSLINIDLQPLAAMGTTLIEKLSSAIGWVATHETPKRIALEQYIKDIQNDPRFDALTKAALVSQAKKTIKEYCNQYEVVQFALEYSGAETHTYSEQLSDDWIESFMDKARLASDEAIQRLWGRILAQECTKPNSVPKHLLTILTSVDAYLAEAFSMVKSHSILLHDNETRYFPIIDCKTWHTYFNNVGLDANALNDLAAVGLITFFPGPQSTIDLETEHATFWYGHQQFVIDDDGLPTLEAGHVFFTRAGEKLCQIIDMVEIYGFTEICLPGIGVSYHSITDTLE